MKKYLMIVVALMAVSAVFAFQPSSMLIGGGFEFKSEQADADDDVRTTIAFYPQLSGFVIENLCGDLILSYASSSYQKNSDSIFGIGVGGRYFFKNLYGGADFSYNLINSKALGAKLKTNAMYLTPKVGYLAPVTPNTYIDLQGYYKMGLGTYGGDLADFDFDNEESCFGIRVGVQVNMNL